MAHAGRSQDQHHPSRGTPAEGRPADARGRGSADRRRRAASRTRPRAIPLAVVSALSLFALIAGWSLRSELYLSPEEGAGYALGISGLAAMLLLLPYSIRKRARFMRGWGPLWPWFQVHMMLGIVGPTLILFHANFRLGSLNSAVAVTCMVLVVASGVAGRVIYARIHKGLSGRRMTLAEISHEKSRIWAELEQATSAAPELAWLFKEFESFALAPSPGMLRDAVQLLFGPLRAWRTKRAAFHCLERALRRPTTAGRDLRSMNARRTREAIVGYIRSVQQVASFSVLERAFAAWHVIHLPITVLLAITAVIHVVAVHMY